MSDDKVWRCYQAEAVYWHEQRIQDCRETARRSWFSLLAALILCMVMLCVTVFSLCQKKVAVMLVHHRSDASVWLSQVDASAVTHVSHAEEEGNIVQYIQARESYNAVSYPYQYEYVKHASTQGVYHYYANHESYHHSNSKIRRDGIAYSRTVLIHDVMFMPVFHHSSPKSVSSKQDPMADVSYRVCRRLLSNDTRHCLEKHALLAWHYRGIPADPKERWLNWRGFAVSYFQTVLLSHASRQSSHLSGLSSDRRRNS